MKKLLTIIFILFSISLFAKDINIGDKIININLNIKDKSTYVDRILDVNKNVDFVSNCEYNNQLWSFGVKKDGDYNGEEIIFTPNDAKKLEIQKTKSSVILTWSNVSKENIDTTFTVIATIEIKNGNSYWHIKITPSNNIYGLTTVTYPQIGNMRTNDTTMMLPFRGGRFFKNLDFDYEYKTPSHMSYASMTKNDSTLYFCPEDVNCTYKQYIFNSNSELNMLFAIRNELDNYAKGGLEYNQNYKYNIAIVDGDYYDAAKKYRKWGIENNYGAFKIGRLDQRKNIPQWWKDNTAWFVWDNTHDGIKSIISNVDFLGVPCAVHRYLWPKYTMDTNYPNFLPAVDNFNEEIKELQEHNIKVMPYTNCYLVDVQNSQYYKDYGDILLNIKANGEFNVASEWDQGRAKNVVACPMSPYSDLFVKELSNIVKEHNVDAFYLDQTGSSPSWQCFNKAHIHPMGAGTNRISAFCDLINNLKEETYKIKGGYLPFATEDYAEMYPFDGWLRCNDGWAETSDAPINTMVFSGYTISFGDIYYPKELEGNSKAAINKLSVDLVKGIQPGWFIGENYELIKHKEFGEFFKKVAQGRYLTKDYFNLGEMVKPVNIVSDNPTINLLWTNFLGEQNLDFPVVRTCSYNYKGKIIIVFTNISDNEINVEWNAIAKDLNLNKKSLYNLNEIYPNKTNKKIKALKDTFTIPPESVVIFELY